MTDIKIANFLLGTLILISFTMFVWTINYVSASNDIQVPSAISAFNG